MFNFDVLKFTGGFSNKVKELEVAYEEFSGRYYNIGVNSATAAADMIFAYLANEHGCLKVTLPTLSFSSPAMMALKNGHYIEIVDINEYLNQKVYSDINMPVLYGGSTLSIENSKIVDAAHNPNYWGVTADFIFTSFFPSKPIKAFSGGMISVDIKMERAALYFYKYRNFGRDASSSQVVQEGNKYYMDGFNAEIIKGQLTQNKITKDSLKRELQLSMYDDLSEFGTIVEHSSDSSFYLGSLILNKPVANELRSKTAHLFNSRLHYPLLHKQSYFLDHPRCTVNKCEYADYLENRLFTLPVSDHYEHYQITYFKEEIIKCLRSL